MNNHFTRRDAVKAIGAAATEALIGTGEAIALSHEHVPHPIATKNEHNHARHRTLRLAHITDVHVQPERRAREGLIAALHSLQVIDDGPKLILNGGDTIMDSFEADDARTALQWDIWRSVLQNECSIPVRSCIGNHDVWGWNKKDSKTTGGEPNYGKKRGIEMLNLPERYYGFDESGWHFIVLDSTQTDGGDGYLALLDEPQFDWLERELKATNPGTPVLVLSHIPIIAASALIFARQNDRGEFTVPNSYVHADALRIKDLFTGHPNVKLCLSGHLHHVDRVDYNGVSYLCNGAVSANWWKGRHKDTDEGFAIIDLFDDGTFEHEYVKYGWKAAN